MSDFQTERLAFIDFQLMFLGSVSRQDLRDRFGLSEPAATRVLALYREKAPRNLEYSHVERTYLAEQGFTPLFQHSGAQALMVLANGQHIAFPQQGQKSILRSDLPMELDTPDPCVVSVITRAIHNEKVISVDYRSHSSGLTRRQIAPFALIYNGLRWHIRAFDRMRKRFSDFVISRISNPQIEDSIVLGHENWEQDIQWNRIVELEIVPHPRRPHPETSIFEYQMANGVMRLRVRAAVAGYFLRRWNVDCSPDHSLDGNEYLLWLTNRETLYGVETLEIAPGYAQHNSSNAI